LQKDLILSPIKRRNRRLEDEIVRMSINCSSVAASKL